MRKHTLIFLYNPDNRQYLEKLPNESGISWTDHWMDAYDFSNIFFLFRPFIKKYIAYIYSVNLKWYTAPNYLYKGLV